MGGGHGARLSNGGCGFHPPLFRPQGRHSLRPKQEGRLGAREAHRHTPVMVLTGASVNEEMRAELCDLRALLRFKPLGMSELLAETRTLLAHDWAGPSDTTNLKSSVA